MKSEDLWECRHAALRPSYVAPTPQDLITLACDLVHQVTDMTIQQPPDASAYHVQLPIDHTSASTRPQTAALIGAVLGIASSVLGAVASIWAATGNTPVFVYARFQDLSALTTKTFLLGAPLEVFSTWLFLATLGIARARPPRGARSVLAFICSATLLGVWMIEVWKTDGLCVTASGALLGAALTFVACIARPIGRPRQIWTEFWHAATTARGRWKMLTVMWFVLTSLFIVSDIEPGSPGAAMNAGSTNFLRWYRAQNPPDLGAEMRVDAFVDITDKRVASVLPIINKMIERAIARTGRKIRLTVRDFPMDPRCNPYARLKTSDMGCSAASAVRVVRNRYGDEVATGLTRWLLNASDLTPQSLRAEVEKHGPMPNYEGEMRAHLSEVIKDAGEAGAVGVSEVPSVFVNGIIAPVAYLEAVLVDTARPRTPQQAPAANASFPSWRTLTSTSTRRHR